MTLARTEDLLAVISRARKAKSPSAMIGSSNDFMKGLSRKSYYVGRISALQEIIMGDHSDAAAKLAMKVCLCVSVGARTKTKEFATCNELIHRRWEQA